MCSVYTQNPHTSHVHVTLQWSINEWSTVTYGMWLANTLCCCKHMWDLFSWCARPANIWGFPSTIKTVFVCYFLRVKFRVTATSFAALRDTALANRLITVPPIFVFSPCPLTSISSADSSHRFFHSSGGFNPPLQRQRCIQSAWVSPHSGGLLALTYSGKMDTCTTKHPHALLQHLGCLTSPL